MRIFSTVRPRTRWVTSAGAAALLAATGLWVAGPAGAATGCQVTYQTDQWTGGFTASITLNVGPTAVSAWTLTWSYTAGQQVSSAWNATVGQSGGAVTARNMSYNGQVAAGGSVQFGLQGTFTAANPAPTDFALNGTACGGAGTPSPTAGSPSAARS
ncbi:MAG TPA: cellulose binding domain-containing protein, partial [Rugosimonospora sp.]|nr:cellulose binding domain-containing protein [Rugosimonospora sp.]